MNYKDKLAKLGVKIPRILLPNKECDLSKFAVLACDQFEEQPEYWNRLKKYVGNAPSALNMILPEAFLLKGDNNYDKRIEYMDKYLRNGTLEDIGESMIFTLRKTPDGTRRGLVCAFDLEEYEYEPGKNNLIKVTERTDISRLAPRVEIRKKAPIELPHILMLIVDKKDLLMNMLLCENEKMELAYDFDLFENGGHLTGYIITNEETYERIADTLNQIYEENGSFFSFAVGDGNHSIATAKANWEKIKKELTSEEQKDHPARYCLAEIINLYDKAMPYECMNRLLTNVSDKEKALSDMDLDLDSLPSLQELQPVLDKWLIENPGSSLEYIHDADTCAKLGEDPNSIAFCYREFDRDSVYRIISNNDVFVRKSFSMGHPEEKRFYLESRIIIK